MPISPPGGVQDALARVGMWVRGRYDFGVDGGAVSTIALTSGTPIPSGYTVLGGFVDVTVACTSGGAATIACQVEAANDILTAVAVASWTTGRKNILPALAAGALTANASLVRTTANRDISIVIGAFALTAGVFDVWLMVVPGAV
jgi:hypothetical protein